MNEPNAGQAATGWDADPDPSQETILLLQEEVARLEAELRARDEALFAAAPAPEAGGSSEEALGRRVAELTAELAARDETVNLLLEQSQLFEEAALAARAEWEQLNQWVEEVERRVEGRDESVDGLRAELEAERARSESLRREAESDRRGWEARRAGLEREAEHLRGLLAGGADGSTGDGAGAALLAVEEENRRLRAACAELQKRSAAAEDAADLRRRLAAAEAELAQARDAIRALDDERRRERNEWEAEMTALRSRLARESLQGAAGPAPAPDAAADERPVLDADERIRAFRQHLKELHEREAEERANLTFSARLSRLWRRTGPGA
jgi:DNA repair exonuclease SbcCD ATPase subunit